MNFYHEIEQSLKWYDFYKEIRGKEPTENSRCDVKLLAPATATAGQRCRLTANYTNVFQPLSTRFTHADSRNWDINDRKLKKEN